MTELSTIIGKDIKIPVFSSTSKVELSSFSAKECEKKDTNPTPQPTPTPTSSTTATVGVSPTPSPHYGDSSGNGGSVYLVVVALVVIGYLIGKNRGGGDPTIRVRVDRGSRD